MPDAPRDTAGDVSVDAPPSLVTRPGVADVGADEPRVTTSRHERTQSAAPARGDAASQLSPAAQPLVPVTVVALLLIAVHGVATVMRVSRSWWWQDDFKVLAAVADQPLTLGLLFQDYNGHLQPGMWLNGWLVMHLEPYVWWPAALVQTVLAVATDIALFMLLRRLFGSRPAILVPLAACCASGVGLPATLWWAAALQWVPAALCMALALYFHVGYEVNGRTRDAVGAVAAVAGGLFFTERAVAAVAVMALVTILYLTPGPFPRRPRLAVRRRPAYWTALTVLVGAYVPYFLTSTSAVAIPSKSLGDVVTLGREMLFYSIIPGMLGGPLQWYSPGGVSAIATPPRAFLHLTWLIALIVVVGSMVVRRGAWRAWLIAGSFLVANVIILAYSRGGITGPAIGRDGRYCTDLAIVAVVCATLAWLPLRLRSATGEVVADPALAAGPHAAGPHADGADDEDDDDIADRWSKTRPRVGAAFVYGAVILLTVAGLTTGSRYMQAWTTNPSQAYFRTLRAELAAAGSEVAVFDQRVPAPIMIPEFGDAAQLSNVMRPFDQRPRFVTWAPQVQVVDDLGHLRQPKVQGLDVALDEPVCSRRQVTVTLPAPALEWAWKVRLSYTAAAPTPAVITVGNAHMEVELEKGQHEVFASFIGGGPTVKVSGFAPRTRVCLSGATVGEIVPMP